MCSKKPHSWLMSYSQKTALRASKARRQLGFPACTMKRGCVSHFGLLRIEASKTCSQTLILEVGRQGPAWAPGHGAGLSWVAVQAITSAGLHRGAHVGAPEATEASLLARSAWTRREALMTCIGMEGCEGLRCWWYICLRRKSTD